MVRVEYLSRWGRRALNVCGPMGLILQVLADCIILLGSPTAVEQALSSAQTAERLGQQGPEEEVSEVDRAQKKKKKKKGAETAAHAPLALSPLPPSLRQLQRLPCLWGHGLILSRCSVYFKNIIIGSLAVQNGSRQVAGKRLLVRGRLSWRLPEPWSNFSTHRPWTAPPACPWCWTCW